MIEERPLDVIGWEAIDVDLTGAETEQTCLDRLETALETIVRQHEPLPIVVRIIFKGEPTSRVHEKIVGDQEYWREAVRSSALAWQGERVWVEKVKVLTRPASAASGKGETSGPLLELENLVAGLKADDDRLLDLGSELAELFQKLPVDYRQGEEILRPDDLQPLSDLVDQAQALLRVKLKKEAMDDENP